MEWFLSLYQYYKIRYFGHIVIDNFFDKSDIDYLIKKSSDEKYANNFYDGYYAIDFDNDFNSLKISPKIIDSIKEKIPTLKNKKYSRSWSFVYDSVCEGVPVHIDDPSRITVNIWLTPNECISDESKNGLILFNKSVSKLSQMGEYNNPNSVGYVKDSKYVRIPYKFNRAVIFYGNMFHKTDSVSMKPGKNNRRINYTFLFDR